MLGATPSPLPDRETGEVVFDFDHWDAKAFYFHDPAGNIVEVIAHEGIDEHGLSELGLVGDPNELAPPLLELGLELWDGTLDEPGRLAFIGERGRTLILSPEGRGWLPTGRPAEPHPVEAVISGPPPGRVELAERALRHRECVAAQARAIAMRCARVGWLSIQMYDQTGGSGCWRS